MLFRLLISFDQIVDDAFTSNNGVIYKYRCCEIVLRFKYGVGGKMEDDFPILSILKVIAVTIN
jgi:hypothetical protein